MILANCRGKSSSTCEFKKDKGDLKKNPKPVKTSIKEAIIVSTENPMQISVECTSDGKVSYLKETRKKRPTLK